MKKIRLKKGREKSLLRRHPWVFSGAVQQVDRGCRPGDTVDIVSSDGRWLAKGAYSPESQIVARVWTFERDIAVDRQFFKEKLLSAVKWREGIYPEVAQDTYRLCFSESDGLPGVIVDRYAGWLVVQFLSAGAEKWRDDILSVLMEIFPGMNILDRSDADVREKEGLTPRTEIVFGGELPGPVEVNEGSVRFMVDLWNGHKTGFYLDQKENRRTFGRYCSNKLVLNCFSYTGGFGAYALSGGARHVVNIDSSEDALKLAEKNFELNGFGPDQYTLQLSDVFVSLRKYRDRAEQFDVIVLDPPKFISSASQLRSGTRGYKDINLLALKLLKPGGVLFTFSCSGLLDPQLFQKIIADAATDANREARIMDYLSQSPDHPVNIHFPESLYLKGLVIKV